MVNVFSYKTTEWMTWKEQLMGLERLYLDKTHETEESKKFMLDNGICFLAESEGILIGEAYGMQLDKWPVEDDDPELSHWLELKRQFVSKPIFYISACGVVEQSKSQKLSRRLFNSLLKASKNSGYKMILYHTQEKIKNLLIKWCSAEVLQVLPTWYGEQIPHFLCKVSLD